MHSERSKKLQQKGLCHSQADEGPNGSTHTGQKTFSRHSKIILTKKFMLSFKTVNNSVQILACLHPIILLKKRKKKTDLLILSQCWKTIITQIAGSERADSQNKMQIPHTLWPENGRQASHSAIHQLVFHTAGVPKFNPDLTHAQHCT